MHAPCTKHTHNVNNKSRAEKLCEKAREHENRETEREMVEENNRFRHKNSQSVPEECMERFGTRTI